VVLGAGIAGSEYGGIGGGSSGEGQEKLQHDRRQQNPGGQGPQSAEG
jgi:hypothetical protein